MGYHRSISFTPSSSSSSSSSSLPITRSKFQSRSASLPCRSDPLVASLQEHSLTVRSWSRSTTQSDGSGRWISDGFGLMSRLAVSLLELLGHPQAAEPLRLHRCERVLEDLLRLADAHSCFRDGLLSLNQALTETQSAVRRRDASHLAAAVRAQRRAEKELTQLAATAREISRLGRFTADNSDDHAALLIVSIRESVAVTASASAGVFSCVVGMSVESVLDIADSVWGQWSGCPIASPVRFSTSVASPFVKVSKVWWIVDVLRWRRRSNKRRQMDQENEQAMSGEAIKGEEMERRQVLQRLSEVERCIGTAETGCAEIYRALMNARVSLLNVLTPNS